jgi:hypothetical protein
MLILHSIYIMIKRTVRAEEGYLNKKNKKKTFPYIVVYNKICACSNTLKRLIKVHDYMPNNPLN